MPTAAFFFTTGNNLNLLAVASVLVIAEAPTSILWVYFID